MYIILLLLLVLLILLNIIKKPYRVETFKVIYKSLDECNKKNVSTAINDIYNGIRHLKQKVTILNKPKYLDMYNWYLSETYIERNMNNRKVILNTNLNTKNMSVGEIKKIQRKTAITNIKAAASTDEDFKRMAKKQKKPLSKENKLIDSMMDDALDGGDQSLSELNEEWVKIKSSLIIRDDSKISSKMGKINKMSFKREWKKKRKVWKTKCKACNRQCSVSKIHCGTRFPKFTDLELNNLRKPFQDKIQKEVAKLALSVLLLRNIKRPIQLKLEIKLMKKDLMGDAIKEYGR